MRKIFAFWALFTFCQKSNSQDLFSTKSTSNYANYLFDIENYSQAAAEYERLYFMNPTDTVLVKVVKAYRKSGQIAKGLSRLKSKVDKQDFSEPLASEYLRLLLLANEHKKLNAEIGEFRQINDSQRYDFKLRSLLLQGKWSEVKLFFDSTQTSILSKSEAIPLIIKGLAYKPKKVTLAVLFSALIPGTGKVYAQNWKDGLISFVLVAGPSFQSYRAFNRLGSKNALGYVYAGIGTGFYMGNLVGTAKETRKRNKLAYEKLLAEVRNLVFADF
jgi:tetratricopeptide (TPR) repeat protein